MTGTIATALVLVVSPSLNAVAYSTHGQLFDGKVNGHSIVKRSTTPFCKAVRVLIAEGIKPDTTFVMRHAGSAADALRSTVGVAAGLTVADDSGGKPIFRKWSPYDREETLPVASPVRETDPALARMRSRMQQGKQSQMGSFAITSVGYLGEVPMSSGGLLGVSVIGIGDVSLASPSRFERLNH